MINAKDGDFFISDWLRNRNTVEFLGIWETVYNPVFNYGEFAIIKSQAGLNNFKISAKDRVEKTGAIGPNSCNLAACQNCSLLPETCCEESNMLLDRAMLIGTLDKSSVGYFNF